VIGPPQAAVAGAQPHGCIAQRVQGLLRGHRQLRDTLDAEHRGGELGEDCGLVAAARADLQHALGTAQRERLRHEGHHVRLGDRLPVADGKRMILIGGAAAARRDEEMPRHTPHRLEHPGIADVTILDLQPHHPLRGRVRLGSVPHHGAPGPQKATRMGSSLRRMR
jgi:hypothetical protein